MIKICAISDIHRGYKNIYRLQPEIESSDIVVIAGDLAPLKWYTRWELYKRAIAQINKPILAVHGNWDGKKIQEFLAPYSIHAGFAVVEDVGFFGVGGSIKTPLHTPVEYSEEEIYEFMCRGFEKIQHQPVKVLLSHNPPKNVCDRTIFKTHAGSVAIAKFCTEYNIDVCICGHIHEAHGVARLGNTTVVNAGALKSGYYASICVARNGVEAVIKRL
ncbi:MAG: metallophosphoesterase [Spirochaetes bacterium]|nr:metallophosphoesterase [Spirochaetota bacterium]